jgi:ribonuclease HI
LQRIVYVAQGALGNLGKNPKVCIPRFTPTSLRVDTTLAWFDGAAQHNGFLSSVGGVIKFDDHKVYRWTLNCGKGTNSKAELIGAWATLTLAARLSVYDIHVLEDSKIVIDWLNRKGALKVANLDGWKDRIFELIPHFRSISFVHIYREENKEVDCLSKKALYSSRGRIAYSQWVGGHEGPTLFINLY